MVVVFSCRVVPCNAPDIVGEVQRSSSFVVVRRRSSLFVVVRRSSLRSRA
jgi:hypothetical protein